MLFPALSSSCKMRWHAAKSWGSHSSPDWCFAYVILGTTQETSLIFIPFEYPRLKQYFCRVWRYLDSIRPKATRYLDQRVYWVLHLKQPMVKGCYLENCGAIKHYRTFVWFLVLRHRMMRQTAYFSTIVGKTTFFDIAQGFALHHQLGVFFHHLPVTKKPLKHLCFVIQTLFSLRKFIHLLDCEIFECTADLINSL